MIRATGVLLTVVMRKLEDAVQLKWICTAWHDGTA